MYMGGLRMRLPRPEKSAKPVIDDEAVTLLGKWLNRFFPNTKGAIILVRQLDGDTFILPMIGDHVPEGMDAFVDTLLQDG